VTQLHAGVRLRSLTSTTEVLITMGSDGVLTCGGQAMVPVTEAEIRTEPSPGGVGDEGRTLLGKRYQAPNGTLQVLCVRQGNGTLAFDGVPLQLLKPKLLPASD
jgi:hypothetical protein